MDEEKIIKIYVKGLETIFNREIKIHEFDEMIDNSGLYFGKSKFVSDLKKYRHSVLESDYFVILNKLDFSKLSKKDKEVISYKNDVDEDVIMIVKRTISKVIMVGDQEFFTYEFAVPDRILKNGILTLEFICGVNMKQLNNNDYLSNRKSQKKFIDDLILKLQNNIKDIFGIDSFILRDKRG